MSGAFKYRVHEVAKDFDIPTKDVMNIVEEYSALPKNHMQALTDMELNILFDYITFHNQAEDINAVLESLMEEIPVSPTPPEPIPEPAAVLATEVPDPTPQTPGTISSEPKPVQSGVQAGRQPSHMPVKGETQPQNAPRPAPQVNQQGGQPQAHVPQHRSGQKHYVDTRGNSVDLARYDERIDAMVPEDSRNVTVSKEKLKKAPDKKPAVMSSKRRYEEQEKMRKLQMEMQRVKQQLKVSIPDEIAVGELAARLKKTSAEVIKQLIKMGVMASVSQTIDFDTASLVAMEFNAKVEREVFVTIEEKLFDESVDETVDLVPRSPVVVVMGHVDHGKTSLLDSIRKTSVVSGEAGGITQHIGAYRVSINDRDITFLDTPGHAAFTSMRMRGAQVTDIVILVVAADDGIMPQTIEAISHAKDAGVPIIVAVNKMDRPDANPDKVMQQLTEYNLVAEEWGGETIVCPVSAVKGDGIEHLLEMVLLTADMRELTANPSRAAKGTVIEAKLDKGRGPVATVLVQNGSLRTGDVIIAGKTVGHVRAMTDDKGNKIDIAAPSTPVEIIGLSEVPEAGDQFRSVADERMARELVEQRKEKEKEDKNTQARAVSLDDLFAQIKDGQVRELKLIIKADVHGSAEALKSSLEKISNQEVRVRIIHTGVGGVTPSDVQLASASNAIIIGFNVRPDSTSLETAAQHNVDIRTYRVIYECIEEIELAIKGMLAPKFKEKVQGHVSVRQIFKASGVGTIGGCYVQDGKITRNSNVRVVRDGVLIYEGELASLKRFKDDAKEVAAGYECGLRLERFNDIKEGDSLESYIMEEVKE